MNKHLVLVGLLLSVALLSIAATVYPGGSLADPQSVGYSWTRNFISNLFQPKAVNGTDNPARWWAAAGMVMLSAGLTLFFLRYAERIPQKSARRVIRICGSIAMVCMVLVVTPLHDIMVTLSSTFFLLALFYITVFIFRGRQYGWGALCVACLLLAYYTLYLYGAGPYDTLPVFQKLTFVSMLMLVLGLEYFTPERIE